MMRRRRYARTRAQEDQGVAMPRTYADVTKERVTRYVVTHIGRDGLRTILGPAQGRFTHATAEEAQAHMEAIAANNSREVLAQLYGDPERLEVRACQCWPGHFDPVGIYFD